MDVALTIFRIGVGVGVLLVGIGVVLAVLALRPVARDLRSLAGDVRRLSRLTEQELPALLAREPATPAALAGGEPAESGAQRVAVGPVQSADEREDERIA
ncbi:MAG: hypothetical protein ACRDHD_08920 [Candidatus Limnocylindria bacterium]